MKITNVLNLPQPLVAAVSNDDYDAGDSDISVTRLISPPRKVALEAKYGGEITEDAADRIWSLMGQSIHTILERADCSAITEKRLFTECRGWKVSGAFDRLALLSGTAFKGVLSDWKMASVWELIHGVKPEREQQLNLLRLLAARNGYDVAKLEIVFIFRDWQKSKAKFDREYPPRQVAVVGIPMWSMKKAEAFLENRVVAHQFARARLPLCTDEDRWKDPDKWAVMKAGRKSALRVLGRHVEAEVWCLEHGHATTGLDPDTDEGIFTLRPGISIVHRPSVARRCQDYCSVSGKCSQYLSEIQEAAE